MRESQTPVNLVSFDRRKFIKGALGIGAGSLVGQQFSQARSVDSELIMGLELEAKTLTQIQHSLEVLRHQRGSRISILQGTTDAHSTQFSAVHRRDQQLEFFVMDSWSQIVPNVRAHQIQFLNEPFQISRIRVSGLSLNQDYALRVFDNRQNQIIDERSFRALDLLKENFKFAPCSCMNVQRHDPRIWRRLVQSDPDLILFIGDSVYADAGSPNGVADPRYLWRKFVEARNTLEIFYSPKLIPILATWDDHDFGANDSDSIHYPFVTESQQNFLNFYAQDPSGLSYFHRGPGVASALFMGNNLILMMDNRSFRLPSGSRDRYAHWGQEQEEWALQLINSFSGTTFLCTGSQVVPQMPFKESMSGDHPLQYEEFLKKLRRSSSKVAFISGDVHFSEVVALEKNLLGYPSLELTSSSIHSRSIPGVLLLTSHRRRLQATDERNFLLVEAQALNQGTQLDIQSFGIGPNPIFRQVARI
jgi:hypothetical protein